jgi:hypothetical protein
MRRAPSRHNYLLASTSFPLRTGVLPDLSTSTYAMSAPRRCPALLAYGLACALLAAQWALAAYRCPLEVRTASMEAMRTIGLPCDEIDEHERVLCHRHLVQAPQSLEGTKTPLPTLPDVAPWRSVPSQRWQTPRDARPGRRSRRARGRRPIRCTSPR